MDIDEAINRMRRERPMYYNRDGTPIVSDDRMSDTLKWSEMFEKTADRRVAQTITLYHERLSTVFLGLDHSFTMSGPPIIFETMLFAPESDELHKAKRARLSKVAASFDKNRAIEEIEKFAEEEYIEKHYPHDNLQERYATEAQAEAGHRRLKLQCLIPPRWRCFILYRIFRDEIWRIWS